MGLDGLTLTEASKIKVDRLNKWNTLIQNTSLHNYE